jgi:hypothetical protein
MKSLSFRIDDATLVETDKLLPYLKRTRNKYFNDAVKYYNNLLKKRIIASQLEKESKLVRKESMKVLHEFEALEDEY